MTSSTQPADPQMAVPKRILIVDDDDQVLFVFHRTLVRLGSEYEVVTARNGREALDSVREKAFDLVITDLRMADMDGLQLTEAISALDSDTIVIWMTAYGYRRSRVDAARLGVYRCLDKPLEIAEIRQIVREALEAAERGASATSSTR